MYIVTIENGGVSTEIHGRKQKLTSGSIVAGLNSIDSFSMSLLPSNNGFDKVRNYTTLVNVYNTNKKRYEFFGRVLCTNTGMSESGLITKDVTCESYFGFLCDSMQAYVEERNWTMQEFLSHIIGVHNSQVESYKHFKIGTVTVKDPNDNLWCGIQRKNTWETLKEKLIDVLGGELQFRVENGEIYLDYLTEIGTTKATAITLSRNMKSITNEKDPTEYITRLIPLGCKLTKELTSTDDKGNVTTETVTTEERLDISGVNDGVNYIDDEDAITLYGIHVGYVEYDDVADAANLLKKGREWLTENNKVQVKYTVEALDLSLLGLDIDDFCVGNSHPLKNPLLGISDTGRIIKKTIDVCEETKSTFEIGEKFKTASEILIGQSKELENNLNTIEKIQADYVTNQMLKSTKKELSSLISHSAERISLLVEKQEEIINGDNEFRQKVETELEILAGEITANFTTTETRIEEIDGVLTTFYQEVHKYISMADGCLKLGASDSRVTLTLENDLIKFCYDGVEIGSWDGTNFYTGNIVVRLEERLQLGNFAYLPRSDGSVMFVKVG